MIPAMLSAQAFTLAAGQKKLLDQVSFTIAEGARCAILGPNGAGKSSLLKAFCRLLPAGAGQLCVAGRPVADYRPKELAQWLAYVPQTSDRENHFTVGEFVLLGRYPHLSPFSSVSRQDREEVERALALTRMADFRDRRMHTLSGGEYQKVLIAAALAQGSRILLLDEPAAFLDPSQRSQIYELLEELHQAAGLTMVEVTHDLSRASLWHDHILGLANGRVVFDGPAEKFTQPEILEGLYGRRFLLAPHPVTGTMIAWPEVRT